MTSNCPIIVHIGKSGGDNIITKFLTYYNIKLDYIHVHDNQQKIEQTLLHRNNICVLLRDPCKRFISIFFYWKKAHFLFMQNKKCVHKKFILKNIQCFENFNTPNNIAEALSSDNDDLKKLATSSLNDMHHIKMGISHYLISKKFIDKIKHHIKFIIKHENYSNDLLLFHNFCSSYYNISKNKYSDFISSKPGNTDEFNNEKFLSPLAIKNLHTYFSDDYDMYDYLCQLNLISKEYLEDFI